MSHDLSSTTRLFAYDCTNNSASSGSASSLSITHWLEETTNEISTSPSSPEGTTSQSLKRKRSASSTRQICSGGSHPTPLKKKYLQEHLASLGVMSAFQTPQKNNASGPRTTPSSARETTTTETSETYPVKDPMWVKRRMEVHQLFRQLPAAFSQEAYSDFKETVLLPILQDRNSGVKPESAKRFASRYEYHKEVNEETIKREMLNRIIKDEFQVLVKPTEGDTQAVYEACDTFEKGLVAQYSQPFKRRYLPNKYTTLGFDRKDAEVRSRADGMTNPIPDGVWGFNPNQFAPTDSADLDDLATVVQGILWAFFLIEVKPDGGSMEECRNQACRGGATLVNAARGFMKKLGPSVENIGPDRDTYVYSAVMDADFMEWYVHWAEVCADGKIKYHMDWTKAVMFREEDTLRKLRGPVHSILEWGLFKRLPMLKERYDLILEAEQQEMREKLAATPKSALKSRKRSKRDLASMQSFHNEDDDLA